MRYLLAVLFIVTPAVVAQRQPLPTKEDVEWIIEERKRLTAPGQQFTLEKEQFVVKVEDEVPAYETAQKIGDGYDFGVELAAKGQAILVPVGTPVRLLETRSFVCLAFATLNMLCDDFDVRLRKVFAELISNKVPALPPSITKEEYVRSREQKLQWFRNRDVHHYLQGEYALVRVLDGEHAGQKGYVLMTELIKPIPTRATSN